MTNIRYGYILSIDENGKSVWVPANSLGIQGSTPWTRKTSAYSAVNTDRIIADTSGGSWILSLPTSPTTGDYVEITDGANFETNNLIIDRNGSTIEGYADNILLTIPNTTYQFIYNNTTWEIVASAGKQGDIGPIGHTGATGAQGAGNQGSTGVQGSIGATGAQGFQGNQGSTGAGVQGNQGSTGVQGVQGNVGATGIGVQGNQGSTGVQGIQGNQGSTGAGVQGNQGSTGVWGATGPQGVQGNQGSTGIQGIQGNQGSTGVQGVQGNIGATGVQGVQGNVGATGVQGVQGNVGATGAGVQGNQGATGVQGVQGNVGATGVQGVQGNRGATGEFGATGLRGATGFTGSTGPQGNQGSTGVWGSTGFTGSTGPQGNQGATGPSTAINATAVNSGATGFVVFVDAAGSNQTPEVRTAGTSFSFNPGDNLLFAGGVSSDRYIIGTGMISTLTGTTKTLASSDNGFVILTTNSAATTITVPSGGMPVGFSVTVAQYASGQVTFSPSSSIIRNRQGHTKTAGPWAVVSLVHTSTGYFILAGDTAA